MTAIPNIVLFAGLFIGLVFGAVGLVSGFCLTSGLRNWWTQGDGRLVRSFALALAVAIAGTQILAARGMVDLSQSIYLQPAFSAPLMAFGGLLFGYGMVAANACASRSCTGRRPPCMTFQCRLCSLPGGRAIRLRASSSSH